MSARVAITGFGALTPVGGDAESSWAALTAGESGVRPIDEPWVQGMPVTFAATVPDEYLTGISVPERRRLDRVQQFAMVAGREAWAHAGSPGVDRDRLAVVIGNAIGGITSMLEQVERLREGGPRRVYPHTVTMMMGNGAAAWLSMELGARAGARAPVSACASGSEALLMARQMILAGDADVVVAGGVEACVTALTIAALSQTRALSRRNDDPQRASRPFDIARDGFVLGEGAALLVLESEQHARRPGSTDTRMARRSIRHLGRVRHRQRRPREPGPHDDARTAVGGIRARATSISCTRTRHPRRRATSTRVRPSTRRSGRSR